MGHPQIGEWECMGHPPIGIELEPAGSNYWRLPGKVDWPGIGCWFGFAIACCSSAMVKSKFLVNGGLSSSTEGFSTRASSRAFWEHLSGAMSPTVGSAPALI